MRPRPCLNIAWGWVAFWLQSCANLSALFTHLQPAGVLHGIPFQEDDRVPPHVCKSSPFPLPARRNPV